MTRRGYWGLAAVLFVGAAVRFVGLETPARPVFDESFYIPEACDLLGMHEMGCGGGTATAHPPVGKWLIAAGIIVTGDPLQGGRVVAALVGTATIGILFLLAIRLTGSVVAAVVGSLLLAVDFLHVVHSRLAMLEVFVTFFVVVALFCAVLDRAALSAAVPTEQGRPATGLGRDVTWGTWSGRWRAVTGILAGLAVATKWTAAFIVVGLIVLALQPRRDEPGPYWPALRMELGRQWKSILVYLVIIPSAVYVATFAGSVDGSVLTVPWKDSWAHGFIQHHAEMLDYHFQIRRAVGGAFNHPYASAPWTWLLVQRPIPYSFDIVEGKFREILALGNPLAWWPAIIVLIALLFRRRTVDGLSRRILLVGSAVTYGFWLLFSPRLSNVFIYYLVPSTPFLCLALGAVAAKWLRFGTGRAAVGLYLILILVTFAFFYPVLTWRPLTPEGWRQRMVSAGCRPPQPLPRSAGERPVYPAVYAGQHLPYRTSVDGWCWI